MTARRPPTFPARPAEATHTAATAEPGDATSGGPGARDEPGGATSGGPLAGDAAATQRAPLATGADVLRLEFQDHRLFHELLGHHDEHLKSVERALGVRIGVAGKALSISGDEVDRELAGKVLTQLYGVLERGLPVYGSDVDYAVRILSGDRTANVKDIFLDTIYIAAHRRVITPKSVAQKAYIDAIRQHDIVFAIGPAGTGKCIAGSTLLLTTRGLMPIAAIGEGTRPGEYRTVDEEVASLAGVERASHVYNGGRSRTRRIRTRFGYEIEVTPEHPLLRMRADGTPVWERADVLEVGQFVALQRGQALFGNARAIDFEYRPNGRYDHAKPIAVETLDENLAYLLGLLTGDGCLTFRNRVILSSADPEIVECFCRFAEKLGLRVFRNGGDRPYDYIIASAQLYQLLLSLGLTAGKATEKRIPRAVLCAPREIVRGFLRGLFDTDGTVERRCGYPSLCSASKYLIDEVQVILLNFGIVAAKRTRTVEYRGSTRQYYEVEMRGAEAARFYADIGFALARKQALGKRLPSNTNVDIIPHVAGLIDLAVRATTLSRASHKMVYDYRIARRRPSYAKLGEILDLLARCATADAYRRLKELHDQRLFWAEVTDIEEGEADVYDLTVPGSHSFCAGGFINHNTYLAMAMGVAEVMKQGFTRIILTRPAVEAGEKLGFLPGDLAEKVNPYLRPLYDALHDMVDFDRARKMLERGTIEVAPLAFMRGRAQPYFSPVLTPRGWRPIGSLRVGDSVIGSDGRPTRVLGVYPQGSREVFRVTAQDGASTLCCGEHLWSVYTASDRRRGKPARVLETREMIDRLRSAHQHRFELPLISHPVEFQPRAVPMDPYALGLLLGDGCITGKTTPSFSTADAELVLALEREFDGIRLVARGGVDYNLRHVDGGRGGLRISNPVTVTLRELGLCGTRSETKFVPTSYLYNSPRTRLALLQGLLDTDGGPVCQRGRTCRVQYTTTSPQLRDDVVFLVRSLGGVAYWRTRAAAGRRPGRAHGRDVGYRHDAYVLDIRLPEGTMPFRLMRKWERFVDAGGGGRPMRYIDRIEPVGRQDVLCIRVAAEDSLYVTDDFLLTHNTLNDSFVILDEAQNTTPEQMKMFLTRLGYGSKAVITGDITQIDLPAGKLSGLKEAQHILRDIPGIEFVRFSERDVVRHRLVQDIIAAYERAENPPERGGS